MKTSRLVQIGLLILWQLPQNIIALLMLPFLGDKKIIKQENFTLIYSCSKMKGGISLGNFIFLDPTLSQKEVTIRHELGHVKQSHMLGWFYLLIIGLPSILNAMFKFTECYYSWYTESWANKLMDLKVIKNQYGCYLTISKTKK